MADKIKIKLKDSDVNVPTYHSSGAACVDIEANEDVAVRPNRHALIGTGMSLELPKGHCLLIFPRSSLGAAGLMLANSVGVIDEDYRGEIMLNMYNTTYRTIVIKKGQRIAQGMLVKPVHIEFSETSTLSETERGCGGFGSTGK